MWRRRARPRHPDIGIGLLQRGPPVPEGLDLGARQHETGLDPVEEVVVVPRSAVLGDELFTFLGHTNKSKGPL